MDACTNRLVDLEGGLCSTSSLSVLFSQLNWRQGQQLRGDGEIVGGLKKEEKI